METKSSMEFGNGNGLGGLEPETETETESFKDQVKGFLKASAEMGVELAKGCRDIVKQSLGNEDSYVVKKFGPHWNRVSRRLSFLNEFLPDDRDPVHAWSVVLFVSVLAFTALNVNTEYATSTPLLKEVSIHPPNASRILLPDGRYLGYREQGVPSVRARHSMIAPHSFLSSRLSGIPGVKASLLEEFGICLVTYDLPGFGESDPHPNRNLESSALDMFHLANTLGIDDKFWVVGYSSGSMHAWAALRYIPDRLAGAAMFAPVVNPYDPSMTKQERYGVWEKWTFRRKVMYFLARRFPRVLPYLYRKSYLSGKHGQIEKWLSLSLGKRDKALIGEPTFVEFWQRDVEESIRQGDAKPFVEEAVMQVSNWGFRLEELKMQKKHLGSGFLSWLKSKYSKEEEELTGFIGPIHIWQGMDDRVVPPSTTDFVHRILPGATIHKLPYEGHFSYFYFCDKCHRQIFNTLFVTPQGPLDIADEVVDKTSIDDEEEEKKSNIELLDPEEVNLGDSATTSHPIFIV